MVSWVVDSLEQKFSLHLYGHYLGLLVTLAVYLAGSVLVALVTFPLIEERGIAVGKRLIGRVWGKHPPRADDELPMNTQNETKRLRARLRASYALFALTLLAVFVTLSVYRKANPEAVNRTDAEYLREIGEYQAQIQTLSAGVLENQRALKNTEEELRKAQDVITQLRARPQT
jgi:hypothetical protein